MKILNIEAPSEDYKMLHALHCVDWRDMPDELRYQVYETVASIFQNAEPTMSFDFLTEKVEKEVNKKKTGGLLSFMRKHD